MKPFRCWLHSGKTYIRSTQEWECHDCLRRWRSSVRIGNKHRETSTPSRMRTFVASVKRMVRGEAH